MKEGLKEQLKRGREKQTLTQQDMASMLGCSRTWYTLIENGNVQPSVEHAKKIAKRFNLKWTDFFND